MILVQYHLYHKLAIIMIFVVMFYVYKIPCVCYHFLFSSYCNELSILYPILVRLQLSVELITTSVHKATERYNINL